MMKNILFILFGILFLCNACIKDDSTLPDKPISEITISSPSGTMAVDVGTEFVYEPEVEQTGDLALTYEWAYQKINKNGNADSLKVLSDERVLRHRFNGLGEYSLRLKVSNEHGSSYQRYSILVRALDEGILVLSKDDNGKGRVSYMRRLSNEEEEQGMEETFNPELFTSINPGYELNDPVDIEKVEGNIYLLSRGDNLLYRMDNQTFELYSTIELGTEFPWMRPMGICSKDRSIFNFFLASEQGGFVDIDYNSDVATKKSGMPDGTWDKMYRYWHGAGTSKMRAFHIFLNYEQSMVFTKMDLLRSNYLRGFPDEELVNIVMQKMIGTNQVNVFLVTRSKERPEEIHYRVGWISNATATSPVLSWGIDQKNNWYDYRYTATGEITLTRESIMKSSYIQEITFYTNGDKLYRWYPDMYAHQPLPEQPVLDLDGKEITCLEFSSDWKRLYVGVYDSSLPDLKGSVYVYEIDVTDRLQLVKKYEGIADRPIKVFWKK